MAAFCFGAAAHGFAPLSESESGPCVSMGDADGEATLKKFYRERNRARLEPANKSMKPIYRDKLDILGVLVGVVRKY